MPINNPQSIPRVWIDEQGRMDNSNLQTIRHLWFDELGQVSETNSNPTSQYPRHGSRWTQAEVTHAVSAVSSGTTINALASILGRKPSAVDSALQKKLGRFYRVRFNVRFDSADHWMPSERDRNSSHYPREAAPWHPDEVTYVIREVQNRTPLRHIAESIGRKATSVDQYVAREIGRDTIWSITREGALSTSDEQVASRNARSIVMARLVESVPAVPNTEPDARTMTMRQMVDNIPMSPTSDAVFVAHDEAQFVVSDRTVADMATRQYQTIDEIATIPPEAFNRFFSPRTREYAVTPVTQTDTQIKLFAVAKLSGMALNWAVAKAAGLNPNFDINEPAKHGLPASFRDGNGTGEVLPYFEIDWSASAGLILAEDISFRKYDDPHSVVIDAADVYFAMVCKSPSKTVYWTTEVISKGATALEASLRCYVKLKLGAYVSLPPELQ